jgi:hypothetical protein
MRYTVAKSNIAEILMLTKEYRVVCSKPKFGSDIIVDIAPSQGVTHDQIFFSRNWFYKQQTGQDLIKYNYSIMLKETDNGEPVVQFPAKLNQLAKNEMQRTMQHDLDKLEPEIIKAYRQMRDSGSESTLHVYSVAEQSALEETMRTPEEEAFDRKQREKRARLTAQTTPQSYREKHLPPHPHQSETTYPQNPQQEENMRIIAEFKQAQHHHIVAEQHLAQQTMPAWLRFQKQYSGD